jgi:integrase
MGSSKSAPSFFNCPAYLIRNPYSYCFRMNVPRDLQDVLKRRELRYSLQTGHLGEAKYQARRMASFVQWLFRDLRDRKAKGKTVAGDIQQLINAQFRCSADQQPTSPTRQVERGPKTKQVPSEKLFEVIELYIEEQERGGNWSPKSRTEFGACLNLLSKFCGDIPLSAIDHKAMREYKQALMKLPANMNKSPRYRGKDLHELIKMDIENPMAPATVNKYLDRASSLFRYAVKNGYMSMNPAEGMQLPLTKRDDEFRGVFTHEDLVKLCHSAEYIEDTHKDPYAFWMPILALHTGCRLEELAQLYLDDLREVDGVWVFDINNKQDKRLKTKAGVRLIPIHPFLLDLGIVRYADSLRKQGHVRLFPELRRKRDGYGQAVSGWFAKYKVQCGINIAGEKKDFHSFRHTFANILKQHHTVDGVMISEILGHEVGSITMGRYGKRYSPRMLLEEAVMKVSYGVDLGHLKESQYARTL